MSIREHETRLILHEHDDDEDDDDDDIYNIFLTKHRFVKNINK